MLRGCTRAHKANTILSCGTHATTTGVRTLTLGESVLHLDITSDLNDVHLARVRSSASTQRRQNMHSTCGRARSLASSLHGMIKWTSFEGRHIKTQRIGLTSSPGSWRNASGGRILRRSVTWEPLRPCAMWPPWPISSTVLAARSISGGSNPVLMSGNTCYGVYPLISYRCSLF